MSKNSGKAINGQHVGSGYDVEIRRESAVSALLNIMAPSGDSDYLTTIDIHADQDLQALAVLIGNAPYDWFDGAAQVNDDEWEALAERWDAVATSRAS